ncbi:MAG: phosphate starvation-inducible protein PhoH, partial [Opitutus sp.]|nr:phosphate starvation-inducible protein PhoH [Opitutus sp.]
DESRMIVTGDVTQIDLPRSKSSGLLQAPRILRNIPGIEVHHFTASDVVRHPLVQKIIDAYEHAKASTNDAQRPGHPSES